MLTILLPNMEGFHSEDVTNIPVVYTEGLMKIICYDLGC